MAALKASVGRDCISFIALTRSIHTTAEEGLPLKSRMGTKVKGPPDLWTSVEIFSCGPSWLTAKLRASWPKSVCCVRILAACRMGLSRPSAAMSNLQLTRWFELRVTRASVLRV